MEEYNNILELSPEALEEIAGGKDQKVTATKAGIDIHSGPGKNFNVIATTTSGAMANYTGEMRYIEGEAWVHVRWNGKSGWILAKYVKIV